MGKKDFTKALNKPELTNPALAFISSATPLQEEEPKEEPKKEPAKEKTPKVKKTTPKAEDTAFKDVIDLYNYKEKKSKQIALFLTPSTLDEITRLAQERGYSRNDFINKILEAYIKGAK